MPPKSDSRKRRKPRCTGDTPSKKIDTGRAGLNTKGKALGVQSKALGSDPPSATQRSEPASADQVSGETSHGEGSQLSAPFPSVKQILKSATGRTEPEEGKEREFHRAGFDALRAHRPWEKAWPGVKYLRDNLPGWKKQYVEYLLDAKKVLNPLLDGQLIADIDSELVTGELSLELSKSLQRTRAKERITPEAALTNRKDHIMDLLHEFRSIKDYGDARKKLGDKLHYQTSRFYASIERDVTSGAMDESARVLELKAEVNKAVQFYAEARPQRLRLRDEASLTARYSELCHRAHAIRCEFFAASKGLDSIFFEYLKVHNRIRDFATKGKRAGRYGGELAEMDITEEKAVQTIVEVNNEDYFAVKEAFQSFRLNAYRRLKQDVSKAKRVFQGKEGDQEALAAVVVAEKNLEEALKDLSGKRDAIMGDTEEHRRLPSIISSWKETGKSSTALRTARTAKKAGGALPQTTTVSASRSQPDKAGTSSDSDTTYDYVGLPELPVFENVDGDEDYAWLQQLSGGGTDADTFPKRASLVD